MRVHGLRLLGACALAGILAGAQAPARADEPVGAKKESAKKDEHEGGNWFTHFWIHRVGGTIGNGLKAGAGKMGRAFNRIGGDGKDQAGEPKKAAEKADKEKREAEKKAAEAKEEADEKAKKEAEKARKEKEKAEKQNRDK